MKTIIAYLLSIVLSIIGILLYHFIYIKWLRINSYVHLTSLYYGEIENIGYREKINPAPYDVFHADEYAIKNIIKERHLLNYMYSKIKYDGHYAYSMANVELPIPHGILFNRTYSFIMVASKAHPNNNRKRIQFLEGILGWGDKTWQIVFLFNPCIISQSISNNRLTNEQHDDRYINDVYIKNRSRIIQVLGDTIDPNGEIVVTGMPIMFYGKEAAAIQAIVEREGRAEGFAKGCKCHFTDTKPPCNLKKRKAKRRKRRTKGTPKGDKGVTAKGGDGK